MYILKGDIIQWTTGCGLISTIGQWLSPDRESKNPTVFQSTRLEGSAGLPKTLKSQRSRSCYQWRNASTTGWMNLPLPVRASRWEANAPFFPVTSHRLQTKGMAHFGVGLLTSNDPNKKNLFQGCPAAWVSVNLDVLKLTTKISHHQSILCQLHTQPYLFMSHLISKWKKKQIIITPNTTITYNQKFIMFFTFQVIVIVGKGLWGMRRGVNMIQTYCTKNSKKEVKEKK